MEGLFSTISIPVWVIIAYIVFNILVQSMPRPTEGRSSEKYIWVYQFLHTLCLNIRLALDPTKRGTALGQGTALGPKGKDDAGN